LSANTPLPVSGFYSNWTPTGFQYSTNSTTGQDGTWTTAGSPSINGGVYTFTIAGGLAAGSWSLWVRGLNVPLLFAHSNTFSVSAVAPPPPPPPPPPPLTPSLTLAAIATQVANTALTVNGSFANWTPSGFQYSTNSTNGIDGSWTTASSPTIGTSSFSFTISAGLSAGSWSLWVRGLNNTSLFAHSNTFSVVAPALTLNPISGQSANTALTVSGTYANWTPTGFQYSLDSTNGSNGSWTTASTPTINSGAFAFTIAAGLSAGSWSLWVRGVNATTVTAHSNTFTISAVAPPPPPPPPPGTKPPRLSGIAVSQPYPISPDHGYNARFCSMLPIGGIGPYKFQMIGDLVYQKYIFPATGQDTSTQFPWEVARYYYPPGTTTDTLTFVCTDARGDKVSLDYTFVKDLSGGFGVSMNNTNPVHNLVTPDYTLDWPTFVPNVYGGDHDSGSDAIAIIAGNTAVWQQAYGSITRTSNAPPPVGNYPMTFSCTSQSGAVRTMSATLSVVQYTPISYIELVGQRVVSTAAFAGTLIGTAAATTPRNAPVWSLKDLTTGGGALAIDQRSGAITVQTQPPAPGSFVFDVSVYDTDPASTFTQRFTVPIVQGTVLSPSQMALAVRPLDNSTPGQIVGQATVGGGGISGGTWSITYQNHFSLPAETAQWYGRPRRYWIDAATGQVYTPPGVVLSYQNPAYEWAPDLVTILCTDGVTSCVQTFTIPVAEAPTTVIHVGQGQVALHGAAGLETLQEAYKICSQLHPGIKYHFKVYANPDPEYYTNATDSKQNGWYGPVKIEGINDANGKQVRFGGTVANTFTHIPSGSTNQGGKGFLLFNDGDGELINVEISYCHNEDSYGIEATRKEGNSYGNVAWVKVRCYHNDQGIETGGIHGTATIYDCDLAHNGHNHVSQGLQHNAYIGAVADLIVRRTITRETTWGHDFKCRAQRALFDSNRFIDLVGTAPCQIDISDGGDYTFTNNYFSKGPHATNGACINYNPEGLLWDVNNMVFSNNTVVLLAIPYGGRYAQIGAVSVTPQKNRFGDVPRFTLDGNRWYLSPQPSLPGIMYAQHYNQYFWDGDESTIPPDSAVFTVSNNTFLAVPPAIDFTDPISGGTVPPLRRAYRHDSMIEAPMSGNYAGFWWGFDQMQFRVAHTAPSGTIVATGSAHRDIYSLQGTRPDPFGPGTTYAIIFAQVDYMPVFNPNPWAAAGKYTVGTEPNGSFALMTGSVALTANSVDWVQVRATAPNGEITDVRIHESLTRRGARCLD
jgi:hypothetical protein